MAGKLQHTTQSFYLKQFEGVDPKEAVWVYDKLRGAAPRSGSRESIGKEGYYYSTQRPDGTWDSSLDDWMTRTEGAALDAYHQILNHRFPAGQERANFIMWLALTHTRTKAMRRVIAETIGQKEQSDSYQLAIDDTKFATYINSYDAAAGSVSSEEERKRIRDSFLHPGDQDYIVPKTQTLQVWSKIRTLVPVLERMTFTLRVPEGDNFFITSDVPLGIFNRSMSRNGEKAFSRQTAEVRVPLTPTLMIMLRHEQVPELVLPYAPGLVRSQNTSRVKVAEHEVYSHRNEEWIQRLVNKYKAQRPQAPITFDGPENFRKIKVPRK